MELMNHHIDDIFRKELETLEVNPPLKVWSDIENRLNRKRKIILLYYRIGFAAGIALLISFYGIYYYNNNYQSQMSKNNIAINNKHNTNQQVSSIVANTQPRTKTQSSNTVSNYNHTQSHSQSDSASGNTDKTNVDANYTSTLQQNTSKNNKIQNTTEQNIDNSELSIISPITCKSISGRRSTFRISIPDNSPDSVIISSKQTEKQDLLASTEVINKPKRWTIEGQYAPIYSYRSLSYVSSSNPSKAAYNNAESGLLAHSYGIKANYEASKHITLQIGLFYSLMGQTLKDIYMVSDAQASIIGTNSDIDTRLINSSLGPISNGNSSPEAAYDLNYIGYNSYINKVGFGETNNLSNNNAYSNAVSRTNASLIQQFKYLEIPLVMRYTIGNRKLKFHLAGGFSTNILLNSDAILKKDGEKNVIGETTNLNAINFACLFGIGLSYPVRPKLDITLEPTFKYHLSNLKVGSSVISSLGRTG
jgi:hypothetical protein